MKLAHFDSDQFLHDYWQKRPVVIRNPWDQWRNPLEPDELAGLACEEGVESRLIIREGGRITLETGPLPETRFGEINGKTATLLVQAVDHHVPDVAALIEPFRFVPDWRIDDVMVSYAVDGGGVGPHFDQYDVFLIQGLGRRRWRVGPPCDAATPLAPHDDLRLIADFAATDEWILEPGDILYVPPRFAHDGVAVGDDCMTYSIGFRAPSLAELVEGWGQHQADALPDEARYTDPELAPQANPGEIAAPALGRMQDIVLAALADRAGFAQWFGRHATVPKYPEIDWQPEQPAEPGEVRDMLAQGAGLLRNGASRMAFIRQSEGVIWLFVNGQMFPCTGDAAALAQQLCAAPLAQVLPPPAVSDAIAELICALINLGALAFEEDEAFEEEE